MSITIKDSLNLGELKAKTDHGATEGLKEGADHVLGVARGKAPLLVDLPRANDERRAHPGELRESGYAREVDESTYEVGFTAYWAGWQHERTDYHHEDGQAKYLEEPLTTEADTVLDMIAARIREAL